MKFKLDKRCYGFRLRILYRPCSWADIYKDENCLNIRFIQSAKKGDGSAMIDFLMAYSKEIGKKIVVPQVQSKILEHILIKRGFKRRIGEHRLVSGLVDIWEID